MKVTLFDDKIKEILDWFRQNIEKRFLRGYFGISTSESIEEDKKAIVRGTFELKSGANIFIQFVNASGYSIKTLSVNDSLAIPIKLAGTNQDPTSNMWEAGALIQFVYSDLQEPAFLMLTDNRSGSNIGSISIDGDEITYTTPEGAIETLEIQDNKVAQTEDTTTDDEIPLLARADNTQESGTTGESIYSSDITINPSTGTITANEINAEIDATKITSGTIDIARLPAAALERIHVVTTEAAMLALTTATVQNGDIVKIYDSTHPENSEMYVVKDDAHLNDLALGYEKYYVGNAVEAARLGHVDKGNNKQFIYLDDGSPIVTTASEGNSTTPVYLKNGVITSTGVDLSTKANLADLATVATSGSYNDLSNKPTIPTIPDITVDSTISGSGNAITAIAVDNTDKHKLTLTRGKTFVEEGDSRLSDSRTPVSHASTATTYGVSSDSNYGHAMASSTTPKANGTAAVGSETAKFARGDHVHPLQTSVSGNAGTADAVDQKVSTANSTYPILIGRTPNATTDIGKYPVYFGSKALLNPSTGTLTIFGNYLKRYSDFDKGDLSANTGGLYWLDQSGSGSTDRLGGIIHHITSEGNSDIGLYAYKNVAGSTYWNSLTLNYNLDGTSWATAPTPSYLDSNNQVVPDYGCTDTGKIVTVDWLRNATGNTALNAATANQIATARTLWGQSFDGSANVIGSLSDVNIINMSGNININRTDITRGTSTTSVTVASCDVRDTANKRIGLFATNYYTDMTSLTGIYAYNTTVATGNSIGSIAVGCDASGNAYTKTITPDYSDTGTTKIATTAWVRNATGNTSLNAATATKLATARSFTTKLDSTAAITFDGSADQDEIPVSGILQIPNGGTGSSTKNFVDLTTNQSIAGSKTFTSSPFIVRDTALLTIDHTDSSSYSDLRFADNGNILATIRLTSSGLLQIGKKATNSDAWYNGPRLQFGNNGSWSLRAYDGVNTSNSLSSTAAGVLSYDGPELPLNDDTTHIPTTEWVRDATGNTSLNAASANKLLPQASVALPITTLAEDGLQLVEVYNNSYPYNYGNVINVQGIAHKGAGQLMLGWSGTTNGIANIYYRNKRDNATTWSDWKTIAYTDSDITGNAATATKLATAITIWGQSFDGSANISGNMTSVGTITHNKGTSEIFAIPDNNINLSTTYSDANKEWWAIAVNKNSNDTTHTGNIFGIGAVQYKNTKNFHAILRVSNPREGNLPTSTDGGAATGNCWGGIGVYYDYTLNRAYPYTSGTDQWPLSSSNTASLVTAYWVRNATGDTTLKSSGWSTARAFTIQDSSGNYSGTATAIDGSEDETLSMPLKATIRNSFRTTAGTPDSAAAKTRIAELLDASNNNSDLAGITFENNTDANMIRFWTYKKGASSYGYTDIYYDTALNKQVLEHSGTLLLTCNTDAKAASDNGVALIIGPKDRTSAAHLIFDRNEIEAKATATTGGALLINNEGHGAVYLEGGNATYRAAKGASIGSSSIPVYSDANGFLQPVTSIDSSLYTDTNTTYTFATGDANGQIKVTSSDGNAQNIDVKGLGAAAYKDVLNNTSTGNLGWTNNTNGAKVITQNTLAYWDGRYANSSNLTYCKKGAFGDIVTHDASEFLTSHQSLADYVTLNTVQTITEAKTFSVAPLVQTAGSSNAFISAEITGNATTSKNWRIGIGLGQSGKGGFYDYTRNLWFLERTNSTGVITLRAYPDDKSVPTKSLTLGTDGKVTADTFVGSLTGNASTADSFSAAKSVTLTGDITGTASSTAGWSITTKRRSCMLGQTNNTSNPWYKVATYAVTSASFDINTTFLVEDTYDTRNFGIFKVSARFNGSKVLDSENTYFKCLVHSGYDLSNFVLVCPTTASPTIELWTKIDKAYVLRRFTVLSEGNRSSSGTYWTLLNKTATAGEAASITTTGTQFIATAVGEVKNAATATKLATARSLTTKLNSTTAVTFDGSADQDEIPVSGTLPIANGGTGATTRLAAFKALNNQSVGTNATHFVTLKSDWSLCGYTAISGVKTLLGLGTAAYIDDSDVVHIAGTETITGSKTFQNQPTLQNTSLTKGTNPSSATYIAVPVCDSVGTSSKNRIGLFETQVDTEGNVNTHIRAYLYTNNSTDSASLTVYCDKDGTKYATCPTPAADDSSTKIATTAWVTANSKKVSLLASRSSDGEWSITSVKKDIPLYIIHQSTSTGSSSTGTGCAITPTSGVSNTRYDSKQAYVLGTIDGTKFAGSNNAEPNVTSDVLIFIPTATTVKLYIRYAADDSDYLMAYQ